MYFASSLSVKLEKKVHVSKKKKHLNFQLKNQKRLWPSG